MFALYIIFPFTIFQITNTLWIVESGRIDLYILISLEWISVFSILIMLILSIKQDKPHYIIIIMNIVVFRSYAPFFDLEGRRYSYNYV